MPNDKRVVSGCVCSLVSATPRRGERVGGSGGAASIAVGEGESVSVTGKTDDETGGLRPAPVFLLSALTGVALSGAYAPMSWFWLALLAPAALLMLWRRLSPRRALWSGWVFGLAHFSTSFYWVYYSLYDFGEAPAAFAVAATVLFVAVLAVYAAGLACATAFAARYVRDIPLCLLLYPSLWVLSEWLRGVVLTGFPWNFIGQAMVDSPFVGVLPLFGTPGASWLAVFFAGCLVLACAKRVYVAAIAAVVAAVLAVSAARLEWSVPAGDEVEFALVQSNIAQDLKFDRDSFQLVVGTYRRLTARASGADFVVWPETALPAYYDLIEKDLIAPLADEIRTAGGAFVLGAFVRDQEGGAYNAVVHATDPPQIYRKRHLVPFGEYLPLRSLFKFFRSWVLIPMSDLAAGRGRGLMRLGGHDVGVSICYEVSFAGLVASALPQAAYLLNVSNDSWFGDSTAPHQHLQIARARAAETARTMVRATSTGISAVIDHKGVVVARSQQFTEQVLTATATPRRGRTPYVAWADTPVLVWSLLASGLAFVPGRRRKYARR